MKLPFTTLLFLMGILSLLTPAYAQEESWEKCGFERIDSLRRADLGYVGSKVAFENWLEKRITEAAEVRTRAVITIPVIVHVVHNGEAVGLGANLPYEQILSQIEVLNEDFQRRAGTNGYNSHPDGAALEVEFCPAVLDEQGNELPEPGVHRYLGNRSSWSENLIEMILKPNTHWDPTKYLNIWVLRFSSFGRSSILGYSQFPEASGLEGLPADDASAQTDGVVIDYRAFGSAEKGDFSSLEAPYDKGRITTHEVGHWLGLRHIWGDESRCRGTDYCDDTPPSSTPHYDCNQTYRTCGYNDMTENYMDYTTDHCQNIFTKDQVARMMAVLTNSPRRKELANSTVCNTVKQNTSTYFTIQYRPNPTPNVVEIILSSDQLDAAQIEVFAADGKKLLHRPIMNSIIELDLQAFANGMYLVKITQGNYHTTAKIIKTN